ncbi:MAG: hypothetical protein ACK50E_00915, partial [Bacteroidota bacterium]
MSISFFLLFFLSLSGKSQSPVIVANGPTSFCFGGKVTLSVSNAPSGVSFQWLRNGAVINDSTRNLLIVKSSGFYRVILDDGSSKDTLAGVQVNVNRPDANLNGNGATTINGDRYFKVCAANAQNFTFTNGSSTSSTNTNYIIRWGDGTPDYTSTSFNSPINHL